MAFRDAPCRDENKMDLYQTQLDKNVRCSHLYTPTQNSFLPNEILKDSSSIHFESNNGNFGFNDEFDSNNILSELWGLSLPKSLHMLRTISPTYISPPTSPNHALNFSRDLGGAPINEKNFDAIIPSDETLLSFIILCNSLLNHHRDLVSVLESIFSKYPTLSVFPRISKCQKSNSLIINLFSYPESEILFDHYHSGLKKYMFRLVATFLRGEKLPEKLLNLFLLRREVISSLSLQRKEEIIISNRILEQIFNNRESSLSQLFELTFVVVDIIKMDNALVKIVLLGDPEGIDILKIFFNQQNNLESGYTQKTLSCEKNSNRNISRRSSQSVVVYIPRCFHSPLIGIAGARLQSILKASGNGSVRVSFPKVMSSPSWEVIISSNHPECAQESIERVKLALYESWHSMVSISTRAKCDCSLNHPVNAEVFSLSQLPHHPNPLSPGTPDSPGVLLTPNNETIREVFVVKNQFPFVHRCDFERVVKQTGAQISCKSNHSGDFIEMSGLPKSHLMQLESMLSWINSARKPQ